MHWDTAVVAALFGLVTGWFVPRLIGLLPEPATDVAADPETESGVEEGAAEAPEEAPEDPARPVHDPWAEKIPYAVLAATPGLAWKTAIASGLVAGVIGLETGWDWPLLWLLYLSPVGVALAYIDFRTWLLPTRIIAPSYSIVISLVLVGTLATGETDNLLRAAAGWLIAGALFWLLWRFTPSMGYGDVRLSGVLGIALGWLGWGELLTGVYAGFVIGSVGWIPLRLLRVTKSRKFPFGPFMLLGALVGILWGADVADYLAAR
jgi:leader peptidase (prepilin peptidase)/N-methyltransferase